MAKLKDLLVWQKSMHLASEIYVLCKENNLLSKDFALNDQMGRASMSIPCNIAEWIWRWWKKEIIRYLIIARWSAVELSTQINLCKMFLYIDEKWVESFEEKIIEIIKMINSMIKNLSIN